MWADFAHRRETDAHNSEVHGFQLPVLCFPNQKNYKHLSVYLTTLAESFETFINLSAI
jgi:hypothetical protein